jgi:chromosome partitioning protein
MHVIALLSQKGGGGRTSLAVSLATAAEEAGHETLIIDLDPQATACKWGDRREAESPIVIDAQASRLGNALAKAREGGIAWAIIDTPPRSAEAALAAAKLADLIVMPIRPQMYDLETIPNTLELIATAGAGRTAAIPVIAILNAIPARGSRHEQARDSLVSLGLTVCDKTIGQRAAFGDAAALGLSVLEYDQTGRAASEIREVYLEIQSILAKPDPSRAAKRQMNSRGAA